MTPKQLLQRWVELFNQYDADGLAGLYHENCVNHQIASGKFEGRERIREMFRDEFSKYEMVCIVENIFEDGNVGILEWRDPKGLRGCGFFWIENDQIVFQRGYWDRLSFMEQQVST